MKQPGSNIGFEPLNNENKTIVGLETKLKEVKRELEKAQEEIIKLKDIIVIAGVDKLTGVQRREFLFPALYDYLLELNYSVEKKERRERKKPSLNSVAVFFADMDGLNKINNEYGHAAGDAALSAIGHRSMEVFSKRKKMGFRYGGDEFVFLDPIEDENTDFDLFLKRIDKDINASLFAEFKYRGKVIKIPVSVSIGCSIVKPGDSRTPKEIIDKADEELMALKKARGTLRK